MYRVFVIGLFLLYFLYMFPLETSSLHKPTSRAPDIPLSRTFNHHFENVGNNLSFVVDTVGTWTIPLPSSVTFQSNRLFARDACHNQPDGARVLASGSLLYDHVRRDRLQPLDVFDFEPDAKTLLQQGDSFYFVCNQGYISGLEQCPPGRVFRNGRCLKIDACTGKDEGVLLPDPFDNTAFYECRGPGEESIRQTCQYNHWFMHDSCRPKDDAVYYCQFFKEPLRIDDTTYLRCRDRKAKYYHCPPGTRLFDKFECESDDCVGKPDGAMVPSKQKVHGVFKFTPGFKECLNEKVVRRTTCPQSWDHSLARDENLTFLPMVFDGDKCSIPKLCENVQCRYVGLIVPSFQFGKRVRNWKWAETYDNLSGYVCSSPQFKTFPKRVAVDPGQVINPKKFKRESACVSNTRTVPIADKWDQFYDCHVGLPFKCPPGHIYDPSSATCVLAISKAHTFNNYPMFRFDSFDPTGWIKPLNYSNAIPVSCTDPETAWNPVYNVCSHPDCESFPFLSQMETFTIKLKEVYSECAFEPATRRIVKQNTMHRYNFWTQRLLPESVETTDECVPGDKIRSGNFLLDSTLYVTCNDAQPFVFCPSAETKGIVKIEDTFACLPPSEAVVDARASLNFESNEIAEIVQAGSSDDANEVSINNGAMQKIGNGIPIDENRRITLKGNGMVKIKYRYRITHPPNIAWKDNQLIKSKTKHGAFLLRRKDFTLKPVDFPSYKVAETISDFEQN